MFVVDARVNCIGRILDICLNYATIRMVNLKIFIFVQRKIYLS